MVRGEETELQLLRTLSITLDATGAGQSVPTGPEQSWERWEVANISTVCNSNNSTTFYIQRQGPGRLTEGTYAGNLDSTDTPYKLSPGERLVFSYINGDPGAIGIVTITGSRYLRGRRAY